MRKTCKSSKVIKINNTGLQYRKKPVLSSLPSFIFFRMMYTLHMEPITTNILLIILGSVSAVLIILLIIIGFQIWKLIRTLQRVANLFANEADHMQKIIGKVRSKIHSILE